MSKLTPTELLTLVDPKNLGYLKELGGITGLAEKLGTNVEHGLSAAKIPQLKEEYGTNSLPEPTSKHFLQFVFEACQDKTLIVLMIAAVVELALGVYKYKFAPESERESTALIDGGAVFVAGIST
jgi:P-type Ca2+ transporter type 2C